MTHAESVSGLAEKGRGRKDAPVRASADLNSLLKLVRSACTTNQLPFVTDSLNDDSQSMLLHISVAELGVESSKHTTKSALSSTSKHMAFPGSVINVVRCPAQIARRSVESTPRADWATWFGGVRSASEMMAARLERRARSVRQGRFFESRTCTERSVIEMTGERQVDAHRTSRTDRGGRR